MIILYVLILIFALWGISYRDYQQTRAQYLSKDSTNAIKGICILLVFLRHGNQYIIDSGYDFSSIWDKAFVLTDGLLGQLIVVMFLFFSGYGVICSIKRKGNEYIRKIPKHRVFSTLLNFDIAVFCFIVVALLMGKSIDLRRVILSFLCWEDVGNSNWYIFVILASYLVTWLSFSMLKRVPSGNKSLFAIILTFIVLLLVGFLLVRAGKSRCWYDTILVYPLGMLYGEYKDRIDLFVNKKFSYITLFVCSLSLFILSYYTLFIDKTNMYGTIIFEFGWVIRVITAIFLTLLVMMRFKISNKFIIWLGLNLFPLYIYQRLPMILVSNYITCNPYLFYTLCFLITCAIVPVFKKIQVKL